MGSNAHKQLENKKYDLLISMLVDYFGADMAADIWLDAEQRLAAFYETTHDLSPTERMHANGTIYPMCAIYLAIAHECTRAEAFDLVSDFMRERALAAGESLQRLVGTRAAKRVFMKGFGIVGSHAFGASAGFEQKIYSKSSRNLRMDILACPYVKHCAAAGAPELAELFCKNDEYAYGSLPGITFERTGTIAQGANRCDFELTLLDERP